MKTKLPANYSLMTGGIVAALFMWAGPASSQTLTDALAAAYMNNPELLAARADLRSEDEAVPQAEQEAGCAGLYPSRNLLGAGGEEGEREDGEDHTRFHAHSPASKASRGR